MLPNHAPVIAEQFGNFVIRLSMLGPRESLTDMSGSTARLQSQHRHPSASAISSRRPTARPRTRSGDPQHHFEPQVGGITDLRTRVNNPLKRRTAAHTVRCSHSPAEYQCQRHILRLSAQSMSLSVTGQRSRSPSPCNRCSSSSARLTVTLSASRPRPDPAADLDIAVPGGVNTRCWRLKHAAGDDVYLVDTTHGGQVRLASRSPAPKPTLCAALTARLRPEPPTST